MGFAKGLPLADIDDVHARADHLVQIRVHCPQRITDDFEAAKGLGVGITWRKGVATVVDGCGAGKVNDGPGPERPAVAYLGFPRRMSEVTLNRHDGSVLVGEQPTAVARMHLCIAMLVVLRRKIDVQYV